jgi:hypothetical protein
MKVVRESLAQAKSLRPIAAILGKLPSPEYINHSHITLVDKKVYRMFGPHPEQGKIITWLPKKIVNDKAVSRVVALKKEHNGTGFGKWRVSVDAEFRLAVYNWLADVLG